MKYYNEYTKGQVLDGQFYTHQCYETFDNYNEPPKDTPLYAVAFRKYRTPERVLHDVKPTLGIIKDDKFYKLKNNGKLYTHHDCHYHYRSYATTKEEATEMYNQLVQLDIEWLNEQLYHCKNSMIRGENNGE